ncbi:hypothetical protein FDECE_12950 [Fusarium decemcellulare]|nr:hypothetical protein FDECE_12950 [Fusarium decemcellulare]
MIFSIFATALALSSLGLVDANPLKKLHVSSKAKIREIYSWDQAGTWAENIAIRENGNLLVTLTDRPELYEINPFKKSARLVHQFDGYTSVLGITELAPNIFTVATGNVSVNPIEPSPKSFSVWKLDFNRGHHGDARVFKVTDLPDAVFLNGLTTLNSASDTILVGDCSAGHVLRLDTKSGEYTVVLDDPLLKPVAGVSPQIGVNGIKTVGDWLYFTNTFQAIFGRVPINRTTGKATGPFQVLVNNTVSDDLIVRNGVGFLAGNRGNVIFEVDTQGNRRTVAGSANSTEVAGATAVAFGRTKRDRNVLYMSTAGTEGNLVGGVAEWGSVKALEIAKNY